MKRNKRAAPSLARANKRAEALIEALLKEMQRGVRDQGLLESPEWERLFGSKQSVVVNVLKLVQAMASLPNESHGQSSSDRESAEGMPLSNEEMQMLTSWLKQGANAQIE